jgi:peroxiredoxin family protein
MSAAAQIGAPSLESRLSALEQEVRALTKSSIEPPSRLELTAESHPGLGQQDKLSLIVFSGSLDRLLAAFILATGAAAMGMQASMFFTFWGTSALRRESVHVKKSLIERMFGWMLPRGSKRLPLSQMNLGGMGPLMIRHLMKKNGAASLEDMLELSKELGVQLHVCTMSMELLGLKPDELIDYPDRSFCGVAKFLETASPGKITMFV